MSDEPVNFEFVEFADLDISAIDLGVVFIYATWSGPARGALNHLQAAIVPNKYPRLRFIVIDNDGAKPQEIAALFGEICHGYGESLWIKNGIVIHRIRGLRNNEQKQITDEFIEAFCRDDDGG